MVLHKRTRLTPLQRKALAQDYHHHKLRKADLCRKVRRELSNRLQNT